MNKRRSEILVGFLTCAISFFITGESVADKKANDPLKKVQNNSLITPVEVTYIGSEGFLISSGTKKVLIDALWDGVNEYSDPNEDVLAKITAGLPPFDNIDIVLCSHNHGDHFSPGLTLDFLENNPDALFISSQLTIDRLSGNSERFDRIKDQTRLVLAEPGQKKEISEKGIRISVMRLDHGRKDLSMQNQGFLFDLDGANIFFTGDWIPFEDNVKKLSLEEEEIDIAFICHPGLLMRESIMKEYFHPKYIVAMHINPGEDDPDSVETVLKEHYPGITVLRKTYDSKIFR